MVSAPVISLSRTNVIFGTLILGAVCAAVHVNQSLIICGDYAPATEYEHQLERAY